MSLRPRVSATHDPFVISIAGAGRWPFVIAVTQRRETVSLVPEAPRYLYFVGSLIRKFQALPEFQFLLDFANRTRGGIALSVLQHDQVLALEHGLKLLDLVVLTITERLIRKNRCGGRWDSNEVMLSRRT